LAAFFKEIYCTVGGALAPPVEACRDKYVSSQKQKFLSLFTGLHLLDIQFVTDQKLKLFPDVTK